MTKTIHPTLRFPSVTVTAVRDGFGEGIIDCARTNEKIVALSADLTESVRFGTFAKQFPERFWNVGISEQHMVSMAAGMAISGLVPFAATYGVFMGRAWDQIRVSVCLNNANVKLVGSHGGVNVGADGPSAQALEDISMLRALPNLTIIVPCDAFECRKATSAVAEMTGATYLRFGREPVPVFTTEDTPFLIGRAEVFREGEDVTILANGGMVYEALVAADVLATEGISVAVVNVHTVKPLDVQTITSMACRTGAIVVAEEHQMIGALGGAVAEALAQTHPVPIELVGMKDVFGESGSMSELHQKYGFTAEAIQKKVHKVLKRKTSSRLGEKK